MRYTPHVVLRKIVRNQSERTTSPALIVLHATEGHNRPGIADLQSLGEWFDDPKAQASSHVATDAEGYSARYVDDERKAWHVAAYNSLALGIEQVGVSAEGGWTRAQYRETARWIAYWSVKHGIPVRKGAVKDGYVTRSGVVRHSDLGVLGGNHDDPGAKYNVHLALALARIYRARIA